MTLRYDKLASGPHVRENFSAFSGKLSMQTHRDELAGAVETIVSEKTVDRNNLFVLANSEGTIHAVNYQLQAKKNRFRGLVLTGAPGRSIGDVGRSQIAGQTKSLPGAETIIKQYDDAIAAFLAGKPMVIDPSLPEGVRQLLYSLESPANLPFARELWDYKLPEHVAHVNEPVLVVIGKKDIQIDWQTDGKALENATAHKPVVTFAYPEHANHILKHEETPRENLTVPYVMEHYNAADAVLDGESTDTIITWLKKLC
jgi:pimeloyl-ACP methyl ester carboxylesterase